MLHSGSFLVIYFIYSGWEDPLEEGMASPSNILAWRIPMDREAWGGYSPWGHKESDTTERLSTHGVCISTPIPQFIPPPVNFNIY